MDTGLRRLYYDIRDADPQVRMDGWQLFLSCENTKHILVPRHSIDDDDDSSGDPSRSAKAALITCLTWYERGDAVACRCSERGTNFDPLA